MLHSLGQTSIDEALEQIFAGPAYRDKSYHPYVEQTQT